MTAKDRTPEAAATDDDVEVDAVQDDIDDGDILDVAAADSDDLGLEFEDDELGLAMAMLEHAGHNLQAVIVGTVAFLADRGVPAADWTAHLGAAFARDWVVEGHLDADEFLDAMLANLQTLGALEVSADFAARPVTATVSGFPDRELCARYGVSPETVATYLDTATPAADRHGLTWSWHLDGDLLVLSVASA